MLHVLLIWAWVWPESFGRWIGTIIKAAKSVLTTPSPTGGKIDE